MVNNKIKVGMVGISFGMEFIPIYMKHPDVYEIAIADTNLELIKTAQEKFGISSKDCYDNYDDMLKDDAIDAIHIVTPPSTHAEFSIKALKAGKHCGCTIPMGMSIQELEDVIKARIESQKQYMFMEPTVFLCEGLAGSGKVWKDTVYDMCSLSGYGRLAFLLGRISTIDAPDTCNWNLPYVTERLSKRSICKRLRKNQRRTDIPVSFTICI